MNREELLKRAREERKIRFVPGHGPNLEKMTDEEIETFLKIVESMNKAGRAALEETD